MIELLRPDSTRPLDLVDKRMRIALMAAAMASGHKAKTLMTEALGKTTPGDLIETKQYFGEDNLKVILGVLDPMIRALNAGMPGFNEWLDRTGYGNDVTMIRALIAWFEADPEMAAIVPRLRHGVRGLE